MAVELFARCVRGLEWVVAAEASALLGATVTGVRHREVGLSVDHLPRPSAAPSLLLPLPLRTADDLFVLVGRIDGVGRHRSALPLVGKAVRKLGGALQAAAPQPADFEVVASFLGKRNYNRFDLEDAVGDASARAVGWRYHSRQGDQRPDVQRTLRVHVEDDVAVLGLRWAARPLHRRDYKVGDWPGTLHPPVAAAMSLIAGDRLGPGAGRRMVDPFCGAGTIAIESLLARRSAAPPSTGPASGVTAGAVELSSTPDPVGRAPALGSTPGAVPDLPDTFAGVAAFGSAVGFDVSPVAVTCARANAERAGVRPGLFVADAARPPWTLSSDDVVVTNPPWGRAVSPSGALHTGDDVLAAVLALTASQRAVVLIDDPDLELADRAVLAVPLSLFGSHPVLAVLDGAGAFPGDSALAEAHAAYG